MMQMSPNRKHGVHENPAAYFRIAVRESRSRAKLCEQYAAVLDELASTEEVFGKSIVKTIGVNLTNAREGWPTETIKLWDHICSAKERLGKQHIGFSVCITQSISRELCDCGRNGSRNIQEIEYKTQALLDALSKSSRHYKKKYGKYARLVQDTEASIIARDGAIRDYAEKINDKSEEAMFGSFNRGLTKVLGKFAPTDALRKQHDRCRHLILELDTIEAELRDGALEIITQQKNYREQMREALREIEEIENKRLEFFKSNLLRFCQATVGMNEHVRDILMKLMVTASALNIQADLEALDSEMEEIRNPSTAIKKPPSDDSVESVGSIGINSSHLSAVPEQHAQQLQGNVEDEAARSLRLSFLMLDRLRSALDSLRHTTQRATSAFVEIGEVEKLYGKSCARGMERHGFVLQSSGGSYSLSSAKSTSTMMKTSGFGPTDSKCYDCMVLYESPMATNGWAGLIELAEKLIQSHCTIAAVLVEKCSTASDTTLRKLDAALRDVNETVADVTKRVDSARAAQAKLSSKLNRLRKELRERRQASTGGGAHPQPKTPGAETKQLGPEMGGEADADMVDRDSFDADGLTKRDKLSGSLSGTESAASASSDFNHAYAQPEKIVRRKSEKSMMHGLENISSVFGAAAVTALGAAGVLDSSNERNITRIANLEEVEKACMEQLVALTATTTDLIHTCLQDMATSMAALKEIIARIIHNMKSTFMMMLDSSMMGLNISTSAVEKLQRCAENIDVSADLHHFLQVLEAATGMSADEEKKTELAVELFDVTLTEFRKIDNELVDMERQNEKESIENDQIQDMAQGGSLYAAASVGVLRGRSGISTKPRRSRSVGDSAERGQLQSPEEVEDTTSPEASPRSQRYSEGCISDVAPPYPLVMDFQREGRGVEGDVVATTVTYAAAGAVSSPIDDSVDKVSLVQDESSQVDEEGSEDGDSFAVASQSLIGALHPNGAEAQMVQRSDSSGEISDVHRLLSPSEFRSIQCDESSVEKQSGEVVEQGGVQVTQDSAAAALSPQPPAYKEPSLNDSFTPSSSPSRAGRADDGVSTSDAKSPSIVSKSTSLGAAGYTTPTSASNLTSPELAKFDLPPDEKILEYFSCAFYPKRGLLTHGRMFITNHHVAFSGWPELRILISLKDIVDVQKKQLFFVNNALTIHDSKGEEHFFGSFLDRDLCYRMLTSLVMIEKSLVELTEETSQQSSQDMDVTTEKSSEPSVHETSVAAPVEDDDDSDSPVDYAQAFKKSGVTMVYNDTVDLPTSDLWRRCWKSKDHFESFLQSEGDFDIVATDWSAFTDSPLTKAQNPGEFPFQFVRTIDYLHPRTSMLMFGPKNATAKQKQYLYLPKSSDSSTDAINRVTSGVVLTATQFEGIPMCDVFEVLMYWSFRTVSGDGSGHIGRKTCVVVGCGVNYLKSTLLKGQIFAGVKEELELLSKNWVSHVLRYQPASAALSPLSDATDTRARASSGAATLVTATKRPSLNSASVGGAVGSKVEPVGVAVSLPSTYSRDRNILLGLILLVLVVQAILIYVLFSHFSRADALNADMIKLLAESLHKSDQAKHCPNSK